MLDTVGAGLTEKDNARDLEEVTNERTKVRHVPTMVRPDTEAPCASISAGTDSTLVGDRDGGLMVWGAANRRVSPVHAHRQPRWPRHVHIAGMEPSDYFQRRSSLTSVPRMCVTGARGAVRPTRALMTSDTLACRTSSDLHF